MKQNNLPKYWVVKADQSNPDWRKVIGYLNKTYNLSWAGERNAYYRYDGSNYTSNGTDINYHISDFKNNPTLLTIKEFVEMTDAPEYVECIKEVYHTNYGKIGKIYQVQNWFHSSSDCMLVGTTSGSTAKNRFKPSTKEAFDKQNQVEEFAKGTYVVALVDGHALGKPEDKYYVGLILTVSHNFNDGTVGLGLEFSSNCCKKTDFKWFATMAEAIKFSESIKVDYTVKGTELPTLPIGTNFRLAQWSDELYDSPFGGVHREGYVSYGRKSYKDTLYILCEKRGYVGTVHFMVKLSDIEKLANKNKKPEETMKTITYANAQRIVDIACTGWKETLFEMWGKKIVLKQDIEITEDKYQEMRKACTVRQHEIFDEIFGKDVKFKVGDWVYWSGNKPITAQIVREATYDRDCWVLNEKTHNSCHQDLLRPATEEEIEKAQYKVGDFIYVTRERDTPGCKLQFGDVEEITSTNFGFVTTKRLQNHGGEIRYGSFRLATVEEIHKAKYIPKGTPCLGRDGDGFGWRLCYSDGNGLFKWTPNGKADKFKEIQVLDVNNLPKY